LQLSYIPKQIHATDTARVFHGLLEVNLQRRRL